jgi:Uma2 family endonuclease
MTVEHNYIARRLGARLRQQLDEREFDVSVNMGQVRRSAESYYIPDVLVIPKELVRPLRGRRDMLEAYGVPLPLVVEVWSPSTGDYDVDAKIPEYQRRGDLEIWRIHPFDRTLTAWRRQPDGSYAEVHYTGGTVQPQALPDVTIDLDTLFD